jgi:single-strand DNA-binding protein
VNGYRVQDTEWHRITAFNGLGKTIQQHCEKGMKVLVRGRIHYTKWTDQQGVDRYGCEIIAETVDFLSRAKQTQNDDGNTVDDDEIPF